MAGDCQFLLVNKFKKKYAVGYVQIWSFLRLTGKLQCLIFVFKHVSYCICVFFSYNM